MISIHLEPPSQRLQADAGVLVGLIGHVAVVLQGSSGYDRKREEMVDFFSATKSEVTA